MKRPFFVIALLGLLTGLASAEEVRVGVATPLTGPAAAFGEQVKNGAEQAAKDINAAGGILGSPLTLKMGDDANDPKQGVSVANYFVSDQVVAVIGHLSSGVSIPASDIYAEAGMIQITPSATNPMLTDRGLKNVFRTTGTDNQMATFGGSWLSQHRKDKKIAVLHDKTAGGNGVAEKVVGALKAGGVADPVLEGINPGEKDYAAVISKLKAAGVEVVYLSLFPAEAGLIIRQARDAGFRAEYFGSDSLATNEIWQIAGGAAEGLRFTFAPDPVTSDRAKKAVEAMKATGIEPEGFTLYSYAAVQIYAAAANGAGSTDVTKVSDYMRSHTFDTVIGPVAFDDKGDIPGFNYVWYVWHDGQYSQDKE